MIEDTIFQQDGIESEDIKKTIDELNLAETDEFKKLISEIEKNNSEIQAAFDSTLANNEMDG